MAHNLNYNEQTEKHSFFSVKEKAWHGLGQIVQDYPTSAEAIKHAGLNYTVEKGHCLLMTMKTIQRMKTQILKSLKLMYRIFCYHAYRYRTGFRRSW